MTATMQDSLPTLDAGVHAGRAALYRSLACAFRYPDELATRTLGDLPGRSVLAALPTRVGSGWGVVEAALDEVRARTTGLAPDVLESEFVRTFGHTIPKEYPPFESEYTAAQTFQQTVVLGDIAGFYSAFGLRLAAGTGERADALSVELEFLHFLAVQAAHVLAKGTDEQATVVGEATRAFLGEHVAVWAPSFARRLREKGGSPLYGSLATLLEAWLRADLALHAIPEPPPLGEPRLLHATEPAEEATAAAERALAEEQGLFAPEEGSP